MTKLYKGDIKVKKLISLILMIVLVLVISGTFSAAKEHYVLRLGHTGAPDYHYQTICKKFAKLVKKRTKGNVEIKVFPKDQLGNQVESVKGVMLGTQDMVLTSDTVLSNWEPDFGILNLPFIFDNNKEVRKVLDSEIGDRFSKKLESHGAIVIGWWENGMRHITNSKHPINKTEDLKGIKIRVPEGEVFMDSFKALGASPTIISFGELYSALQLGTVDAQENPPAHILTQRFYEVQDYVSKTGHIHLSSPLIMNKDLLYSMPKEYQNVIMKTGMELGPIHTKMVEDLEKEQWKEVGELMEINEVDKQPFINKVNSVWDKYKNKLDEELINSILEKLGK